MDNDMIIDYATASPLGVWNGSAYTGVTGMIASAYNFSAWDGYGLTSSAAHDGLTGLGVHEASEALGLTGSTTTWGFFTIDATSVLVKYTYRSEEHTSELQS